MTTPNSKLTVVARFKARPGKESIVRRELTALVAPTRAEKGCINYDLHVSVDDPATFLFHENWESETDLEHHLQSAHVQAWRERSGELLAEPGEITRWWQTG